MANMLELSNVSKRYGQVTAVDRVNLTVEGNKIYGLLGRNGAGKTTIMHLITAQLFATEGEIKVFGETPYENASVLERICFIKESQKYPERFQVHDVLDVAANIFPNWDEAFAQTLMQDFKLPRKRIVKKLSRGMLSSLGIIVGLASRAPLTIFDEPYLGLDAVSRSLFYDRLLADYAENPRTVILSTHLIDEVSRLLEHIIIIDEGKVLMDEEVEAIRGRAITVTGPVAKVEAFGIGREQIHRESLGGLASMTFMGQLGQEDREMAAQLGLELTPVPLQQMFVYLTNRIFTGKAVE